MRPSGLATEREGTKTPARRIVAHAFMTLDGVVTEPGERQTAYMNDELAVSTASAQSDRDDITVIGGDVMAELAALKQQPGKEITVTGGMTLIRSLLQAGLVDDLHLLVHPLVAGSGQRLFPSAGTRIPLTLVEASVSSSGVLHLHYRPPTHSIDSKEATHGKDHPLRGAVPRRLHRGPER